MPPLNSGQALNLCLLRPVTTCLLFGGAVGSPSWPHRRHTQQTNAASMSGSASEGVCRVRRVRAAPSAAEGQAEFVLEPCPSAGRAASMTTETLPVPHGDSVVETTLPSAGVVGVGIDGSQDSTSQVCVH